MRNRDARMPYSENVSIPWVAFGKTVPFRWGAYFSWWVLGWRSSISYAGTLVMVLWMALTSESTQSVGGLAPHIDPVFWDCLCELSCALSFFVVAVLSSLLVPGLIEGPVVALDAAACSSPSRVLLRFFTGSSSPSVFAPPEDSSLSCVEGCCCCCSDSLGGRDLLSCFLVWYLRQTTSSSPRLGCSSALTSDFSGGLTENSRDIARSSCGRVQ